MLALLKPLLPAHLRFVVDIAEDVIELAQDAREWKDLAPADLAQSLSGHAAAIVDDIPASAMVGVTPEERSALVVTVAMLTRVLANAGLVARRRRTSRRASRGA